MSVKIRLIQQTHLYDLLEVWRVSPAAGHLIVECQNPAEWYRSLVRPILLRVYASFWSAQSSAPKELSICERHSFSAGKVKEDRLTSTQSC